MHVVTYVGQLVWENLLWIGVVCLALLPIAPYRAWTLLRNNRPARGTGWKMWQADRYIQVWLAPEPLDSSDTPYELRMPTGLGDSTHDRTIHKRRIDEALERYHLVRRSEGKVAPRRDVFFFPRNWMVYILCKWYLIVFVGDTQKWYAELTPPPTQLQRKIHQVGKVALQRIAAIGGLFVILYLMQFVLPWVMRGFILLAGFMSSHIKTPEM